MSKLDLIPIFSKLEANEKQSLEAMLQSRTYEKGSHLMKFGEVGDEMMFIVSGMVNVSLLNDEGKEFIITRLGPGEMLGELALITGDTRSADIVAIEDSVVFILSKSDFLTHAKNYSGMSLCLLIALARRLSYSTQKSGELALLDVYHRLAKVLNEMVDESDNIISARPTHQELAAMVGTSREVVSRALKNMEQQDSIKIDGKRIIINHLPD
ncbi:MAG: Crp/Fnr family transcriptional regulator [Bdellovibrionota bacterium]